MVFSFFRIIFLASFWGIFLFCGCKSNAPSPEVCIKASQALTNATKTYDTTSTSAKDTVRKKASCVAYGVALKNYIKIGYANGCITASDTVNYTRTLAKITCK